MDSARLESVNVLPPPGEAARPAIGDPLLGPTTAPEPGNGRLVAAAGATAPVLDLKQAALRSSMWTLTAFALSQVIRFGSVYILQAFLDPNDFGVAQTVGFFIVLLTALSDVGIEQSIIQNKRGDEPVFLNTAWTVNVLRGVILWVGACLMAFPVYWFYRGKPEASYMLWMLPVAGLAPLIGGFISTSTYTLQRHLNQGRVTVFGLVYQILAVIVTLLVAWKWRSPWAIIAGGLVAGVFYLVITHTLLIPGYRNHFAWDPQVRAELMKFGKWIMISTLITYLAMQIDRLMIPRLMDFHWAGLYGIALTLVAMPREVIGRLASVSLFPVLSRTVHGSAADVRRVLVRARGLILTASVACMLAVVLIGPILIFYFFKREFHEAGLLARLASIGGWFIMLQVTADRALLAQGKTKPLAVSNAVNLVVTVVAALLGRWFEIRVLGDPYGITGFMLGLAAGKLAGHLAIQVEMARSGLSIFRQDLLYSVILIALAAMGIAVPRLLPGYAVHPMQYNGIAAVTVCAVTCAVAGIKVLRGIR